MKKFQKKPKKQRKMQHTGIESMMTQNKKEMTLERNLNRTKPLTELEERKETLERKNMDDKRIMDDENASPSEKQAAAACIAERDEQLAILDPQIQEREEALPLRERVKNIVKK